jgi:DNA-binding winged helix-turn-helix (wHTH) protein/predicted ATPase
VRPQVERYEFGPFRVVPNESTLYRDGKPLSLTPKAFETLLVLVRQSGRLVTKTALMESLWPNTFVEEGNLAFNISTLRKAMGEGPGHRYIETVPRRGYRFVGGVRPASARAGTLATQTVGRETERAELRRALDASRQGNGQLIAIAGEAGMGKTTLVEGFLSEAEGSMLLRGRCSERLAGTEAYLPFLEALDDLLGGEMGESTETALRSLAPSWHAMTIGGGGLQAVSQERLKRELLTFFQDAGKRSPVVLFIDDLQWADVSTIDLLAYLGHRLDKLPLLVIVCYRGSEMVRGQNPFLGVLRELQGRGRGHEIPLAFLQPKEVGEYLDLAFPKHQFPAAFPRFIHEKTEGNPLFMADVLRDLRRREIIAETGGLFSLSKTVPDIEQDLPESVRSVVERKIAQLDESGRRLLAAASVQGYEFDSAVLAAATGMDIEKVEDALEFLERAYALVERRAEREMPDGTLSLRCRFVHGLYQNALAASLPPARRASLSLAIAEDLLQRHGDRAGEVAGNLAMLFETGRDFGRATKFFLQAAHAALRVFAYPEAAALARRGLGLLRRLPENPDRNSDEVALQTTLGVALMSMEGFAAPEVEQVYGRALELTRGMGSSPQLFPVLGGLWLFNTIRAQLSTAQELAERILSMAADTGNPVLMAQAHQTLGITLMDQGNLVRSLHHFEEAIRLYDPSRHRAHALQYAFDPGVASRASAARVLVPLGRPDSALALVKEAIALAREIAHPPSLGFALTFAAIVHYLRGEPEETEKHATETIALSREHGMAQSLGWGMFWQGWARQDDEGIAQMRQAIESYRFIGSRISAPQFSGLLAEALARQGKTEEAVRLLDEAIRECEETGEGYCETELYLLKGRVTEDETMLRRALESARNRSAVWWELKVALALGDREALKDTLERLKEGQSTALYKRGLEPNLP